MTTSRLGIADITLLTYPIVLGELQPVSLVGTFNINANIVFSKIHFPKLRFVQKGTGLVWDDWNQCLSSSVAQYLDTVIELTKDSYVNGVLVLDIAIEAGEYYGLIYDAENPVNTDIPVLVLDIKAVPKSIFGV